MMFVIVITFSAIPLSLQQLRLQNAFAQDDSHTDTEQRLRQKNSGSGESTNFNCAKNLIESASESVSCDTISTPPAPTPLPESFTISGEGTGTLSCLGDQNDASIEVSAQGEEDGTVTGIVDIII